MVLSNDRAPPHSRGAHLAALGPEIHPGRVIPQCSESSRISLSRGTDERQASICQRIKALLKEPFFFFFVRQKTCRAVRVATWVTKS